MNYQGKKVVIIGLGITGVSCINFFLCRGITPCVMDTRLSPPGLDKLPEQVKSYFGGLNTKYLLLFDLIVVSPSIPLTHPSLIAAANAGIEIIGDIELFCRETKTPIIAITGSNGKSTVTTMVGEIARKSGTNVAIGGNVGLPVLTLLNCNYELFVLELSSFQLETTQSLQAVAATVLNVTEDHMDRYPFGLPQYRKAKLRIYENAKICVVNADDNLTRPIYNINKHYISFGMNRGDYHLHDQHDEIWLQANGENVINVKKIKFSSQSYYINALAALALADAIKLPREASLSVLTTFTGLAHRFQLILERKGVRWINDSKSTNVGSTKAALKNLQVDGTLYLLLGGVDKSADFLPLSQYLNSLKVQTYCFGQSKKKIASLFPNLVKQTETMEQAIRQIALQLKPGDTVLLSPACSSYDQFRNFEHRGDVFSYLAKKLG